MGKRTPATSWADTGRYVPPPPRERLRDLAAVCASIKGCNCVAPLLKQWLCENVASFEDQLADGGRPNLHRMLGLPDGPTRQARARAIRRERNLAYAALADALPGNLGPWTRAGLVFELLTDPSIEATGNLAMLRAGLLGRVPRTQRTVARAIEQATDKFTRGVVSVDPLPVKRSRRGNP